jgi:D-alanyl-D-alanine carboxypeptidase
LACASAFLLVGAVSPAETPKTANTLFPTAVAQRLNASIVAIAKNNNLPSVVVAIVVPHRGRYTFVQGYANLAARTPRTLSQPFRIASITKAFAATAVLRLVDRGVLRKDQTIARWFPQFPNANLITIDDLLRMRSGIPAPNDDEVLARVYDAPLAPAPELAEELASYTRLAPQFNPPNTVGVYTDFSYDVLAGVVLRTTGKGIGALIAESVIRPLRLQHTSYPSGITIPGALRGYGWDPKAKRYVDKTLFNPPLAGAAGAVVSNADDLAVFARALCVGGLLQPQTHTLQLRGQRLVGTRTDYGEGVASGSGVCGHSGTINGFSTDMYYVKRLDASFVISVNRLDRDNRSQTLPLLALVGKAVLDLQPVSTR